MTELLTAEQMRVIEHAAIDSGAVTGLELMECAGRGAVDAIFEEWPDLAKAPHSAVILCGPGNNGGDGFVVARRLRDKGWQVEVLLFGDPKKLPPDAKRNHDIWCSMGAVTPLTVEAAAQGDRPVLLVDAMFGTGLSRAIPLVCANAFHAVRKRDSAERHLSRMSCHTVALDCPSGLDCDSGSYLLPEAPQTDQDDIETQSSWWAEDASRRLLFPHLTVTFHRRKVGHYLGNPIYSLRVVDIGLGREDRHPAHLKKPRSKEVVCLLDFDPPSGKSGRIWPAYDLDKRNAAYHKYDHGHALILSGGSGRTGAARLAARGALRIGAGLVTLGVPPAAQQEVACQITSLMLRRVTDAAALADLLQDARFNALCLGPGLGVGEEQAAVIKTILESERPVVLDADALTVVAKTPALFDSLHENCVLTPHGGEFARLFPDLAEQLKVPPTKGPAYSKVDAARKAAARAGCIVLFKGPDTVIAAPDGRCVINAACYDRAAPWLATAGSGDVLAGFITGLLARGFEPMEAAETAAWLHVECARAFGPGLIAEDLPEVIPKVLRELGL